MFLLDAFGLRSRRRVLVVFVRRSRDGALGVPQGRRLHRCDGVRVRRDVHETSIWLSLAVAVVVSAALLAAAVFLVWRGWRLKPWRACAYVSSARKRAATAARVGFA